MRPDPLTRLLARAVERGRAPGAAWWVEGPAAPALRGAAGHAALEPVERPVALDTPFDLASLTKPLATALLLVLAEQDARVDLEAPAAEHLPELRGSAWDTTTPLELATHSAGFPAWRPLCAAARDVAAAIEAIARERPAAPRGSALYSDLGYILLGGLLERACGRTLDVLFDERVARPLGLARCGFAGAGGAFPDAAATERGSEYERGLAGPDHAGHPWRRDIPPGEVHDSNAHALGGVAGHAGLFGTCADVASVAREILEPRATGLGAAGRRRLLRVGPRSSARTVGFVLARGASAARGILPDDAPGHTGFTGTSVWLDPRTGRVFVLLANRVHPRVPAREFRTLRRAFHRVAASLVPGAD